MGFSSFIYYHLHPHRPAASGINKKVLLKFVADAVNYHLEDLRFTMYKVQFEYLATDVACD